MVTSMRSQGVQGIICVVRGQRVIVIFQFFLFISYSSYYCFGNCHFFKVGRSVTLLLLCYAMGPIRTPYVYVQICGTSIP